MTRRARLYPFTSMDIMPTAPMTSSNTGNVTIEWGPVTVYKPNPFHGIDGWLFALDEWQHRHNRYAGNPEFPWLSWRHPLGSAWWWTWRPYCNWWDRRLIGHSTGRGQS